MRYTPSRVATLTYACDQTSAPITDALNNLLYPGFLRRRFVPQRHQVVAEDIARELLLTDDRDFKDLALVEELAKKTDGCEEENDEVRSRRNDLTTFALSAFGASLWESGLVPITEKSGQLLCVWLLLIVSLFGKWA